MFKAQNVPVLATFAGPGTYVKPRTSQTDRAIEKVKLRISKSHTQDSKNENLVVFLLVPDNVQSLFTPKQAVMGWT